MKTLLLLALLCSPLIAPLVSSAADEAKVIKVTGQAFRGKEPLKAGDVLHAGDQVSAGQDASVDLKLSEGHNARLKSGSEMKIGALKAKLRTLDLLKGKVFVQFTKSRQATKLDVRTKTVVAGVRGTQFMTEIDEKKGTYICVCEGSVEARKPDGGPTRTVGKGQDLWAKPDKALGEAVNSPNMSSMTAQEFETMNY